MVTAAEALAWMNEEGTTRRRLEVTAGGATRVLECWVSPTGKEVFPLSLSSPAPSDLGERVVEDKLPNAGSGWIREGGVPMTRGQAYDQLALCGNQEALAEWQRELGSLVVGPAP